MKKKLIMESQLSTFVEAFWFLNEDSVVPELDVIVSSGRDNIVKYGASIMLDCVKHEKWVKQYLSPQIKELEQMFIWEGIVEYRFQEEGFEWILERVTGEMYYNGHNTHTLYFGEYSSTEICEIDLAFRRIW